MNIKLILLAILDPSEADWLIPGTCEIAVALDALQVRLHAYAPAVFFVRAEPGIFPGLRKWQKSHSIKMQSDFESATRHNDIRAKFCRQEKSVDAQPFLLTSSRVAYPILTHFLSPDRARRLSQCRFTG